MSETLDLNPAEADVIKRMFNGETNDTSTALRWVAQETVDEWRRGHIDLLVVSHTDHDGLWATRVKSTWEGESDDLQGRDHVTLQRAYAVPSVTYTLDSTPAQVRP